MAAVLTFRTTRFEGISEPAKTITPTEGHALLDWLGERLFALGLTAQDQSQFQVEPVEWGWCFEATVFGEPYLFGCGSKHARWNKSGEWALVVKLRRSFVDRLLERGEFTVDNPVVRIVLELLERQPDFSDVELSFD